MHISLAILENVTSSSCTDSAVRGRAKFHSNLLKNVRSTLRPVGAPLMFDKFISLRLTLFILVYQRFSEVFFIDASTVETITADLRSIAVAKGAGDPENDALTCLSRKREEWLLLFNNADDTMLNLRDYFPCCSHGNILITSRNYDIRQHATGQRSHCKVSGLTETEAERLLLDVAGINDDEHADENKYWHRQLSRYIPLHLSGSTLSTIIEQELGYLALAVVQAGAYISRFECGLSRYLEMYRERRGELLEEYRNQVQKIDDYEWTVYTTWTMSFERLSAQAATFLKICAFLHHDGISEAIFQNGARNLANYVPPLPATNQELDSLSTAKAFINWFRATDVLWDTQKFLDVIIEIRSYSLIDFYPKNCLYSIHPLVHSWTLTVIADGASIRICTQYILGMSCSLGSDTEDHIFRRTLLPHVDAALQDGTNAVPDVAPRLERVYIDGGRWEEAEKMGVLFLETSKRVLGEEHPDTLMSMNNLALTYRNQGRWKEAEVLQFSVMETSKRVSGEEHPDTLMSMNNLAVTYQEQGRWKEAEVLNVSVMETRKRVLGEGHPDTLMSMN